MIRTKQDIIIPAGTVFAPCKGKHIAIIIDGDGEMLIEIGDDNILESPELYEEYEPK